MTRLFITLALLASTAAPALAQAPRGEPAAGDAPAGRRALADPDEGGSGEAARGGGDGPAARDEHGAGGAGRGDEAPAARDERGAEAGRGDEAPAARDERGAGEAEGLGAPAAQDERGAQEAGHADDGSAARDESAANDAEREEPDAPAPEGATAAGEAGEGDEPVGPASDPDAEEEPEETLPEEHVPALTVEVDTGEDGVRTGGLVHLAITAEVPEGDDVAVPDQELGSFEIFARRFSSEPVDRGRRRRFRFELDLLALEPGDQELPPIRLRVVTADGEVGTVRTEARTIEIGSHIANEPDAEPRPPTRPVPVYEEDYTLLWVLGSLLALLLTALLSFLVARWWTRRAKKAAPPPPPRPPWEVALEKLGALQREKAALIAEGKEVELVDRVSDVLRDYLGQRYDFNGLESTTDEVVTRLAKVKLRGVRLADVTALLADSDLVKFAKARPDEAQCTRMLEGAVAIVRATTPRPSAVPSARPASGAASARIVTKDGEVALPIAAHTLEQAEREIRTAVGAAFREMASDPSFEGTLRVTLSPALAPSQVVTDSLRRLHTRLSSELATVPLPGGRRARLVIEHFHESLAAAAERGEPAMRTVIDDVGVRVEERAPASAASTKGAASASADTSTRRSASTDAGASTSASTDASASTSADASASASASTDAGASASASTDASASASTDASTGTSTSASAGRGTGTGAPASTGASTDTSAPASTPEDASAPDLPPPLAGEGRGGGRAASTSGSADASTGARAETAAAGAPARRERIKTGPVDWDRPAASKPEAEPSAPAERVKTGPVDWDRRAVADAQTAKLDTEALERVLPALAIGEGSPGAILRWVTGVERPVRYVTADGHVLEASALAALGLTRGGLHERAMANLRRVIPPGFAPGDDPAVLDDEGAAILALPELVPEGAAWIAYPLPGEGLIVMREGAPSTKDELARLAGASDSARVFERPVRVTRRGLEPIEWPRSTAPGFDGGAA